MLSFVINTLIQISIRFVECLQVYRFYNNVYIQLQTVKIRLLIALSSRNFPIILFSANLTLSFYHSCVAKFFYSFILTPPPPPTNPLQQYIFSNTGIIDDISYMFYLVDRIPVIITHKMPFFQSFFSTSFHVDHHICHIFHHCVLRLFSLLRNSCVKRTGCLSKHC